MCIAPFVEGSPVSATRPAKLDSPAYRGVGAAGSISDRTVDPALLTTAEVFGAGTIPSTSPSGTYRIIRSEADASCGTAATAAISTLLASVGCNQAVRGTMLSPDQTYVITAGVLNLPNTASATKVASSLQPTIAKGTGRLNGLDAGGTTTAITSAQSQVAWDTRGHYLVYSIIALASGKAIATAITPAKPASP